MAEVDIRIEIKGVAYIVKATEVVVAPPPPPPPPPPPVDEPGTAFTLVQNATVIEPHDLYNCNPTIDVPTFEAKRKPGSLVLAYTAVTIMPQYGMGNPYYNGLRAVASESNYWHTGSPASIANRLVHPSHPTALWLLRPSAALAQKIAAYNVGALNPYFDGTMCDESQLVPPPKYVEAWRTAVEFKESDLWVYQTQWKQAIVAQFAAYKAAWGPSKAVIANSAGAPYAGIDGITIEASHIEANGIDWAKGKGLSQKAFWEASPAKFGVRPILVTWNYPDKIPGWYLGTSA